MKIECFTTDDRKRVREFVSVPWCLPFYQKSAEWVPPLRIGQESLLSPDHPFLGHARVHLFLARRGKLCVGRIATIINRRYLEFQEDQAAHFGFFEAADSDVAEALFDAAQNDLKDSGLTTLHGPFNLSTNYDCGMLVKGFDDPPQFMMPFNPPVYDSYLTQLGFVKCKDLLAYRLAADFKMPDKIVRIATRARQSANISFRYLNKKNWNQEVSVMLDIYNQAWEKNWGFVPMTENEFRHMCNELKLIAEERLIVFVQSHGKDVGLLIALPDYHQVFHKITTGKLLPTGIFKLLFARHFGSINRMRILTMGIKAEYRAMGLAALMYTQIQQEGLAAGFKEAELSWILEDNRDMNSALCLMGADPYKTYRIYQKEMRF